jgi:hypothetical protein
MIFLLIEKDLASVISAHNDLCFLTYYSIPLSIPNYHLQLKKIPQNKFPVIIVINETTACQNTKPPQRRENLSRVSFVSVDRVQ